MFHSIGFIYMHPLHHGYLKLYQVLLYDTKAQGYFYMLGQDLWAFMVLDNKACDLHFLLSTLN